MAVKYGQTDALALAVADFLNELEGLCTPIEAERRFALVSDLESIPQYDSPASIDVFPDVDATDRTGANNFNSQYAVHLFIQRRTDGTNEEAECAILARLRSEIIEALKTSRLELPNAVHPIARNGIVFIHAKSADRTGLYNLSRLLESHVFESDTILVFKVSS